MIFNNKYTFDFCISWYGFLINVKILLLEPMEKKIVLGRHILNVIKIVSQECIEQFQCETNAL